MERRFERLHNWHKLEGDTLMSLYNIEFEYNEFGSDMDGFSQNVVLDDDITDEEREVQAIQELKNLYPDATDINITNLELA